MSTKIGPFEILSELARSSSGAVYKANDPESGQTVALKVIQLRAFGESSQELEKALLQEAESTKVLSSSNITPVLGAGEIEGKFCAAMEYVQGNSVATMLARKEGFSIWDLLDIGRQLCGGLDHASSKNIVHYNLEPGKIMCGWDGTIKILSFGVSSVGNFAHLVTEGLPGALHYMSPEQVLGQAMDGRSNLFSLGAMLYEMVTERKAFDRDDIASLRQCILETTPVPPIQVNGKVHPLLSDLIVKALAKDPANRYQTGRQLLDDLEKCKESKSLAKKTEAPKGTMAPDRARAAAQAKFAATAVPKRPTPVPSAPPKPASPATSGLARPSAPPRLAQPATPSGLAAPKAAAAAAASGSSGISALATPSKEVQEIDLSDQFITASVTEPSQAPSPYMSSAAAEPAVETFEPQVAPEFEETAPRIAIDPMMAEGGPASTGTSFSEISELPPLKEVYIAPPPPEPASYQPVAEPSPKTTMFAGKLQSEEKPKVQPREVAEKAIKEIRNVPPRLMGYAIGGALAVILAIGIAVAYYVHTLNSEDDSSAARTTPVEEAPAQPVVRQTEAPKPVEKPAVVTPPPVEPAEIEPPEPQPVASTKSHTKKKAAPVQPAIIPGQLALDSTPQGAQVQLDGRSDPSYVTPFALTSLPPGAHTITVSKAGYATDTRTVQVTPGNRTTTVVHLTQLMATLVVKSDPPGANIYVDGRDVGARTPAQVSVDKGQHVVLVRMMGYLDETMNGQFILGQTFNFAPTLRPLGNADNIRTVGKMSKLFGGKGAQAGQATLSVRTQPKGAQIAINQHLLDKNSPVDVALDPGNYVIDITLTGYAPLHKVVTADKGGKIVVDEVLQPQ